MYYQQLYSNDEPFWHSSTDCYYTTRERLSHGRRLSIKLSKETERLEFLPEDGSSMETIWRRGQHASKGRVTGGSSSSSFDQRWELQKVVFEDKGTYILRDYWNKETKSILLEVTSEKHGRYFFYIIYVKWF